MNKRFKSTNFKSFAKYFYNSTSHFKFYSKVNSQQCISNIKNHFFAQNLLHLSNTLFLNKINKVKLMLVGSNNELVQDEIITEIDEIIENNQRNLLSLSMLGDRK